MFREVQARYEEECRAKQVAHDNLISADRRAHANQVAGGSYTSKVFLSQNWTELIDKLLQFCTTVKTWKITSITFFSISWWLLCRNK